MEPERLVVVHEAPAPAHARVRRLGDRGDAQALPAARRLPAVGRRAADARSAQAHRRVGEDPALVAAGAGGRDEAVGARAARCHADGPRPRRAPGRDLLRRARAGVPLRRRGLRPADRRGARVRDAGRRLRPAGPAGDPRRSRDVHRVRAISRACSRRASRPAARRRSRRRGPGTTRRGRHGRSTRRPSADAARSGGAFAGDVFESRFEPSEIDAREAKQRGPHRRESVLQLCRH